MEIKKPVEEKKETEEVTVEKYATDFQDVFQTPDGVMDFNHYLAWLGNKLVRIEKGILG